jgi:hypothetical protein
MAQGQYAITEEVLTEVGRIVSFASVSSHSTRSGTMDHDLVVPIDHFSNRVPMGRLLGTTWRWKSSQHHCWWLSRSCFNGGWTTWPLHERKPSEEQTRWWRIDTTSPLLCILCLSRCSLFLCCCCKPKHKNVMAAEVARVATRCREAQEVQTRAQWGTWRRCHWHVTAWFLDVYFRVMNSTCQLVTWWPFLRLFSLCSEV